MARKKEPTRNKYMQGYVDWDDRVLRQRVHRMAERGWSEGKIAEKIGITPRQLKKAKEEDPRVAKALTSGRQRAVEEVEDMLYKTAMQGNVSAMIFFLKCRGGWTEKQEKQKVEFVVPKFTGENDLED